jgi:small multidrug resistance family-3 protein
MSWILGAFGGFVLFLYGIVPTFQSSYFHRIHAAYGGIFIISSIIWGIIIDKKKPDRFEVIGSLIAICGAIIIFYTPR